MNFIALKNTNDKKLHIANYAGGTMHILSSFFNDNVIRPLADELVKKRLIQEARIALSSNIILGSRQPLHSVHTRKDNKIFSKLVRLHSLTNVIIEFISFTKKTGKIFTHSSLFYNVRISSE
jgi:hypothetical protein